MCPLRFVKLDKLISIVFSNGQRAQFSRPLTVSSSHATPSPPFPPPFDDVPLKEVKKKRGEGRERGIGIRGENFSPGGSSSIDKCLNFPSPLGRGKEKFHRFSPVTRIVNLLFEKWRGLNWSRNERLKICRPAAWMLVICTCYGQLD